MANEVVITVNADTRKAQKGLSGIADKMKAVGKGATIAGGLITGFAAVSLAKFSKAGDEVHKMALRTGFGTVALSELRVAAELSGTSLAALETGIRKMQDSIIEGARGSLIYVEAFDELGVSIDDIRKLSPEKQFEKLTIALAGIEDPALRTAIGMDIFGRAGTALLPMLADGKEGLEAMKKQAHDLGQVFDEEAAAKAARLTDAMFTMKGSMEGVMMVIAESLAPIVTDLALKIEKAVSWVIEWSEANPELARTIALVTTAVGLLLVVLGPLMILLPAIVTIAPAVGAAFAIMTGPIGWITLAIVGLGAAWATNLGGIREITETVFNFIKDLYESKLGWLMPEGNLIKGLLRLKDNWRDIWNGIVTGFKGTVDAIRDMVNLIIGFINTIKIVTGLKIDIPELGETPWNRQKDVGAGLAGPVWEQQRFVAAGPSPIGIGWTTAEQEAARFQRGAADTPEHECPKINLVMNGAVVAERMSDVIGDNLVDYAEMDEGGRIC